MTAPEQLLQRFNETAVDFSPQRTVVELLARHAAEQPSALAVEDAREALTYAELDARANRLAHVLLAHGAEPDTCVAICVAACAEMVVGALAALKAGAAYVPVDPDYPPERIGLILEDTAPVAVLVDETTPHAVLDSMSGIAIHLGEDPEHHDAAARDATSPGIEPALRSLAYVVYTSGSTGRPKGVEVEHHSLTNLALAENWAAGATPADRFAQTAAPAFDATVMEIWQPLVAGASLHIAPNKLRRDPRRLVEWLADREISITMVPTAIVSMLFDRGDLYKRLKVRRLKTGGAALLTRPAPDTPYPLVNMYGPTETTVVATQGMVDPEGEGAPTIGTPLANTRAYVLDSEHRPVGIGELGEIWLGGVQVARGYRGRPDLTAERFVGDPFVDDDGARMYRTGDVGAWREDGRIEFHGRVDDQISIRGYRIEPGEVETALTSHPGIVDAVVVAVQHGRRGEQLAAYFTTTDPSLSVADVRAHAGAILPEYMTPTAYTRLDEFKLTPNGKIDRKALPAPAALRADRDEAYVEPGSDRERALAAIFAGVLEIDKVGVDDDFFALGGDSLDAVACVGAISDEVGEEVAVQELYTHPTVARLAAALEGESAEEAIDWQAESRPDLGGAAPLPGATRSGDRSVLLTGATGFLGPHLLAALAAATRDQGGKIYALVRAPSRAAGAERLQRALVAERHDVSADWDRVVVLTGDLAAPRLGLSEEDFDELTRSIDAICHSGALVHHLYDYRRLRQANVEGTREVLRLAVRAGGCPLLHVSSISTVLELTGGALVERADADQLPPFGSGYGESKWVAERMVVAAAAEGLPARAVRLPRAMGAAHSGAASRTDAAVRLIRGCIELGSYPQWNGWEPWAPVDLLADVLAPAVFDSDGPRVAYPPAAIVGFAEVFRHVAAYGFALEPIPLPVWRERLRAAGESNPAAPVYRHFGLADDGEAQAQGDVPPGPNWSLQPRLPGAEVPPVDSEYVWRMLDYLVSIGHLPRPSAAG